jgi:hypothetical protein
MRKKNNDRHCFSDMRWAIVVGVVFVVGITALFDMSREIARKN